MKALLWAFLWNFRGASFKALVSKCPVCTLHSAQPVISRTIHSLISGSRSNFEGWKVSISSWSHVGALERSSNQGIKVLHQHHFRHQSRNTVKNNQKLCKYWILLDFFKSCGKTPVVSLNSRERVMMKCPSGRLAGWYRTERRTKPLSCTKD